MATRPSHTRPFPLRRTLLGRATATAAAVTAAVVLTACGGGSGSSPAGHSGHGTSASAQPSDSGPATPTGHSGHNAQDVSFAQQMIPHHRQAVAMADLAPTRAKSQQVKDLAARIRKAQDPEITTMTGWLRAWGAPVPDADATGMADMPGMPGMDHSGAGHSASPMPGMMSDSEMSGLEKLSGDAFDRAFLRMMVGHHEGALTMARTEQADGAYGPARAMAKSIVASQSAEITEMKKMLGDQ
ncbi:DUF305 domain-containing protein [Streptomyces mexicanus]|uniref:DUF305 domain-containing protein n=1 Tax=Streptomyces mexicanus TaxID=178566 RepID=A0A7X1HXA2_9ACTN|nr:DUF305 domain-containing protein [Streptomyces mexicanus]MBC2864380.1 DUF305 domain-containing protein [Streptomyces mexicanus]